MAGIGPTVVIPGSHASRLQLLLQKEFDSYCCRLCNRALAFEPTVLILLSDPAEILFHPGERFALAPVELRQGFSSQLDATGAVVHTFGSLDELRRAYATRAGAMIARLLTASADAAKDNCQALFAGSWRQFSADFSAAACVALSATWPGLELVPQAGATPRKAASAIAAFFVMVWMALCSSWSGERAQEQTLEEALERHLVPEAILELTADAFLKMAEKLEGLSFSTRFCVEAVRASILAFRNRENPRVAEWASLFVERALMRRQAGAAAPPFLVALELAAERTRATLPFAILLNACAQQLAKHGPAAFVALAELGDKVGYPDLDVHLFGSLSVQSGEGQPPNLEQALQIIADSPVHGTGHDLFLLISRYLSLLFSNDWSPELLCQATAAVPKLLGDVPEGRAAAQVTLGMKLNERGLPTLTLTQLGEESQAWEEELSVLSRAAMNTERSNALRLCGQRDKALRITEETLAELAAAGEVLPPSLQRNQAILYRESGQHERALELFHRLLPSSDGELRLSLLNSIAATHASLGRCAQAIPHLELAVAMAEGSLRVHRPRLVASLATCLSVTGQSERALHHLRSLTAEPLDRPEELVPYAGAWVNLMQRPGVLDDADRQGIADLFDRLIKMDRVTLDSGDIHNYLNLKRLLASIGELLFSRGKERTALWNLLDQAARRFEGVPDPLALLALARGCLEDDERDAALAYLREVPSAVAARYGGSGDLSLKLEVLSSMHRHFRQLAGQFSELGAWQDLRLLAELNRDMLSRIPVLPNREYSGMLSGFVEPTNEAIARLRGPAAVFEWTDGPEGLLGLVTLIRAEGLFLFEMGLPKVDLEQLAARINQRLSAWHPGRKGDPFDLEDWRRFELWLNEALTGWLPDGGQLVVIEHAELAGLHWHVAAAPRWRTCYVPSWSFLLTAEEAASPLEQDVLGIAVVPRFGESDEVAQALSESVASTERFAARSLLRLERAEHAHCDREVLKTLLGRTTVAKVLCHGFVAPNEQEVAFMVAHAGTLPLADSVAANTALGREHRFGWRECQHLTAAPQVVYSAACSSGRVHIVGLGERVGLWTCLRQAGTRSFIAPRWDIMPTAVLPILDEALERFVSGRSPLGEALHEACVEASRRHPRWLAWALSLEGQWKGHRSWKRNSQST